jgi:hypothetical protein
MQAQSIEGSSLADCEVSMAARRSHPRFLVDSHWDGAMQVLRDVVIHRVHAGEFVTVSTAPAVVGEVMSLDLMAESHNVSLRVRVLECRPVVVTGAVRHEIRLGVESVTRLPTGADRADAE